MPENQPRRPVVGLMTGSFHADYSHKLAQSIHRVLQRRDARLVLFQGLDASRYLNLDDYVDEGFDRHYYSQFEYAKFLQPDVLIVSYSTISAIPQPLTQAALLSRLPQVPVVVLEAEAELPGCVSIMVDNYAGMRDCVAHLVEAHGCQTILFLSGPKGVPDADLRRKAYLDVMHDHGLPVTDDMIAYGDYTDHVVPQLNRLLSLYPRPDALVCANDEMAECACRVLRRCGLRPGVDVAVTGFDDAPQAALMDPPLTSVSQSCDEVAAAAIRLADALLRGEQPASVVLPAQLKLRRSCGCPRREEAPSGIEEREQLLEGRTRIKQLTNENMLASLMLRNLLWEQMSVYSFFRNLGAVLRSLKTPFSAIALLEEPLETDGRRRCFIPDRLRLHLVQHGAELQTWSEETAPLLEAGTRSVRLPGESEPPTAVFPLFYGNTHYGVLMVGLEPEQMLFYYTLSLQIGTGLRYLHMALEQQRTRAALEEKNSILDYSASHDALTGLLNRPGLMNHVYALLRQYEEGTAFVAVLADLDHLKQINDTLGHNAGDRAICKAAEILQRILPHDSPLGRTGGDEFTAVFPLHDGCDADWFRTELARACEGFNRRSDWPFYVGISAGCIQAVTEDFHDLTAMIQKADAKLYEAKRSRRENVIR